MFESRRERSFCTPGVVLAASIWSSTRISRILRHAENCDSIRVSAVFWQVNRPNTEASWELAPVVLLLIRRTRDSRGTERLTILEPLQAERSCFRRSDGGTSPAQTFQPRPTALSFGSLPPKSIRTKYIDEQRAIQHVTPCKKWQQTFHLSFSKQGVIFLPWVQNICCSIRKVNLPPGWELESQSESTDCLTTADYEVLSWRSAPQYAWWLCLTQHHYENLGIFIAAKNEGSWLCIAQCVLCATYLRPGETWLWVKFWRAFHWPWEMNLQLEGLFTFCQVQFMLIFVALLAYKMLRLPKYLKRTQLEEEALHARNRTRIFFYSIQRMTEFLHSSFEVKYVNSITCLYWTLPELRNLSKLNLSEKVT